MLKIQVVFDEESGVVPIDPSGEILISDGRVSIWQKHAYLDSWLDALITGLKQVEAGKSASVDLVEEPDPLLFKPQDRGLRITYRNMSVSVDSVDEFRHALLNASKDFLSNLDKLRGSPNTELLSSIRAFSKQSPS